MRFNDLIAPNAILPALKVNNKKQVLQELAARAAMLTGQNERAIFDLLIQREKLGTTAIGNGIAIPHLKMPTLTRLFGLFARLDRAVDFDALDNQPVVIGAGSGRRRSSPSLGAHCAPAARSDCCAQIARYSRCRIALCRSGHAFGKCRLIRNQLISIQ